MKKNILNTIICILILAVLPFSAFAQKKAAAEQVSIRFSVVDAAGDPVPGAEITVGAIRLIPTGE